MSKDYKKLETSFVINILKLLVSIPIVFYGVAFSFVDWNGFQYIVPVTILSLTFHFYRIRFKQHFGIDNETVFIIVDYNFIGKKFIQIIHSKVGNIQTQVTRGNEFSYIDSEVGVRVRILFSKDGNTRPIATVIAWKNKINE